MSQHTQIPNPIPTLTVTETYYGTAHPSPTEPVANAPTSNPHDSQTAPPPPSQPYDPWAAYYNHFTPPPPPAYPAYPEYAYQQPPMTAPYYPAPPVGVPQDFVAGTVVAPGTAILCILVVAGVYWGLKNYGGSIGGSGGGSEQPKDGEEKKESSSSSSSKTDDKSSSTPTPPPSIPTISPSAFISLFTFALAATVMIQGPLGIRRAFEPTAAAPAAGGGFGALLDLLPGILGAQAARTDPSWQGWPAEGVVPQAGGQGITTGKEGSSQWNWFANPLPPMNGPAGAQGMGGWAAQAAQAPQLSQADRLAFASLPQLLQGTHFCRANPSVCSSLLANADLNRLVRLLAPSLGINVNGPDFATAVDALSASLGQTPTAQSAPVPLVPQKGYLGSVQGMGSLENAFFPLLVGAIGLVVLFDYGT